LLSKTAVAALSTTRDPETLPIFDLLSTKLIGIEADQASLPNF